MCFVKMPPADTEQRKQGYCIIFSVTQKDVMLLNQGAVRKIGLTATIKRKIVHNLPVE